MLYLLGLIVLVLLCILIKFRKNIAFVLKLLTVIVILSLIIMLEIVSNENLINCFFTSLQVGTLNADFQTILGMVVKKNPVFRIIFYNLLLLTPIMFGGFIASFFDNAIQVATFKILRRKSDIYCFSELNEHSLMLADSISKTVKNPVIVFYNYDDNEELKNQARRSYYFVLKNGFYNIIFKSKHQICYFFIKDDGRNNISEGLELLNACKNSNRITSFLNMKMFIFSEESDGEDILNSTDKKGFMVTLLNRNEVIVNNLIFDYPFYNNMGNQKEIAVLIAGSTKVALEIVRSAVWACQFGSEYKLSVTVIDENASQVKRQLEYECPEYFNPKWNYDLQFYDVNIKSKEFDQILNEHCRNTTYAVVCVDNDSLSIQTALYLRRFFIRTDSEFKKEPFIAAFVTSKEKFKAVQELTAVNKEKISLKGWDIYSPKSENYNIVPFGYDDDIYSYENVVENKTAQLALNCHAEYQYMFGDGSIIPTEKLMESFNYNEIDKKSNRANGIHLKYKLYLLGYGLKAENEATSEEIENSKLVLKELHEKLENPDNMDYLARLEHDRWTAFQSSQGWRSVSIEEAKSYSAVTGSHKHLKAKLHPCICTYEELDEIIKVFDPHLKDYDLEFVKKLPEILGLEESIVNVTNKKYICTRLEK